MRERLRQRRTPEKVFLPEEDPNAVVQFMQSVGEARRYVPKPQEQTGPQIDKSKRDQVKKPEGVHKRKKPEQNSPQGNLDI